MCVEQKLENEHFKPPEQGVHKLFPNKICRSRLCDTT